MRVCSESVPQYDLPGLLDLICLYHGPFRLEVKNLLNIIMGEDMMVTSRSFSKTEMQQERNKVGESYIGIRPPTEDMFKEFCILPHGTPLYASASVIPFP